MTKKNGKQKARPGKLTRYLGVDGQFFWTLCGANGECVSDGSQGYSSLTGLTEAIATSKRLMASAIVVDSPTLKADMERAAASRAEIRKTAIQSAENATVATA